MATTDVLAGTPFSINTLPIKASPTPKPAPAPTTAPDLEAQELEAYKQKGQLEELKDEAALKKEKETAEAQAKTTADYAKAVTEDPTRKLLGEKVKERADTTFVPTKETAADMGLLFTLTNIVGFMIGGKSKGNAQQAMSAMNGMLEGHQKGREDLYKKEKAIFEENTKALDKTIEALDRQFKEAMQIYAVDKEAGMAEAQSAIAEHNATFLGDALKKNGLAYSADLLSKAVSQKDKKELAMQKLKQREEDIKRLERQHRETLAATRENKNKPDYEYVVKDGKTYAVNKRNYKDIHEITGVDFTGATKLGAKQPAEKSLKKGEYQAKFVSDIIGEPIDVDTASKAVAGTQYKQKLKDLQEMNSTLGGVPGLKVDFADYINKAIATKAGPDGKFSKEDLDAAYEQLKTDPKLSKSFGALSDDSKVMAKAELDAVMQNLQTKYGNRAPVAEFRATQNVLSRKNMSASSYNRVLANEIQATDDRLKGLGMKPTSVIALERHFAKHPNEVSLMQSIPEDTQSSVDTTTGYPSTNSKGWTLHRDSHGNYGYVSPNGQQVEELE